MFKDSFKYYKSKCPPPSYEDVVDFDKIDENVSLKISIINHCFLFIYLFFFQQKLIVHPINKSLNSNEFRLRGLIPPNQWKIYELKDRPGLIFIRNPFTIRGQRYWITRCLKDYPKAPHAVNLNKKYFDEVVINDWWKILQQTQDVNERLRLKNGMRWTTLGYHHDWDTKIYTEEKRHKFPDDLAKLNQYFAHVLNLGDYSAEAAIVNFYPLGTTLAGHTDHSEKNLDAPLFSIR